MPIYMGQVFPIYSLYQSNVSTLLKQVAAINVNDNLLYMRLQQIVVVKVTVMVIECFYICCIKFFMLFFKTDGLDSEAVAKENMQRALSTGSGGLIPIVYENVKLMSYG
jgi:hypothetical protein